MGFFDSFKSFFVRSSPEDPRTSLSNPEAWLTSIFGATASNGRVVSLQTAMTIPAVWACWRILAETLASISVDVMENTEKGVIPAKNHYLYPLLAHEPSPFYTSFTWREAMQLSGLARGTAYSIIDRDKKTGKIKEFILVSDPVEVVIRDNEPLYRVKSQDPRINGTYNMTEMIAIPIMAFNGISGTDPIATARDILAESMAAAEFGSNYLGNGATPSGIIQYEGELMPENLAKLKESWNKNYTGSKNSGKTAILELGMKYTQISSNAKDANLLELRQFYNNEVARFYNIPPHMIGELERSTNNNIEQQSIDFVRYSMRPYIKRWEQELNRKLFTRNERSRYFVRFNMDSLLRGDTQARAEYYNKLYQVSAITPNEIRAMENLNPIEGGDELFKPMNFEKLSAPPLEE